METAMSLLISRRSLADAHHLSRALDQAFNAWPFSGGADGAATGWVPLTDIFEDASGLKIVTEVPGLKAEDVKLTLENRVLTIKGEKRQVAETQATKVHRYERSYGAFERTFTLPSTVDGSKVEANVEAGVLTVTLPIAEQAKARDIAVTAK
jgi:HSP20 family protein